MSEITGRGAQLAAKYAEHVAKLTDEQKAERAGLWDVCVDFPEGMRDPIEANVYDERTGKLIRDVNSLRFEVGGGAPSRVALSRLDGSLWVAGRGDFLLSHENGRIVIHAALERVDVTRLHVSAVRHMIAACEAWLDVNKEPR